MARAAAMLAAAVGLALMSAAVNAQPGCKIYKTFVPSSTSSTITVPHDFEVASARIIGPASGELSHGNAPAAALPLEAGAFAGDRSGGEWTLTTVPGPSASQGGPSGVTVNAGPLAITAGPSGVSLNLNSTAPNTTQVTVTAAAGPSNAAPSTAGLIGLAEDRRELKKESKEDAFLGALDYLTQLSALNADKANQALTDAIDRVDRGAASARGAITSIGQGLQAKAGELRTGSGSLGDKISSLREAGAADVAQKIQDFMSMSSALTSAAGAATADAAGVVGTAGELFKRGVQGMFGVYTTKEGMAKAQLDAMVANRVNKLNGFVAAATRSLENIKAGKGPITVSGIEMNQAKLEAFSAALERVAATMQRAPTPSALALRSFQFGQAALADAASGLLGGISKFHSLMGQVFPGVRAAMGA